MHTEPVPGFARGRRIDAEWTLGHRAITACGPDCWLKPPAARSEP